MTEEERRRANLIEAYRFGIIAWNQFIKLYKELSK